MAATDINWPNIFNALGDYTRYKIVKLLRGGRDICVSELAGIIGISPPGISQHMKVLEEAGLVRRERQGQKICYKLRREDPSVERILKILAED